MTNFVLVAIIAVQPFVSAPPAKNSDCQCVSLGHGWWTWDDVPGAEYPCDTKGQYWKVERQQEGDRK